MGLVRKYHKNQLSATKLISLFGAAELSLCLVFINQLSLLNYHTSLGILSFAVALFSVYYFAKKGKVALGGNILFIYDDHYFYVVIRGDKR